MADPQHQNVNGSHAHSRNSSHNSLHSISSRSSGPSSAHPYTHAPQTPSRLRQAHAPGSSPTPSPETHFHQYTSLASSPPQVDSPIQDRPLRASSPLVDFESDGIHIQHPYGFSATEALDSITPSGEIVEDEERLAADETTRLLENYRRKSRDCGNSQCSHGTFSPHAASFHEQNEEDFTDSYQNGATQERQTEAALGNGLWGVRSSKSGRPKVGRLESWVSWRGGNTQKGLSTTRLLAESHGIKGRRRMYLAYYIPFLNWISQYRLAFLKGDLIAAITMASFYIPMSLSYASNLGHLPPINGLYSFVFNPLIYALLGTSPQMVVGPEAPGSLLLGNVVRSSVDKGASEDDDFLHARIAGVVTGMAGAIIFLAGLARLGFLESVLSRPFLRGFISAIGIVILADQLVPEMGLVAVQKRLHLDHGSTLEKILFVIRHVPEAHPLTCYVSFGSFVIIMTCRTLKKQFESRYPSVNFIPDRFIVVVLSAIFTYLFSWDKHGLFILGDVQSSTGSPFSFHWPFIPQHMTHIREAMSTSFLIALLGFFESSVAARSLSNNPNPSSNPSLPTLQNIYPSANRDLVALGVANLVGGCFMALPAFGGYGRSKVNASTGGRTPMSSILLSLITLISVLYLVPYFYYLPRGVLSAMVSVVAYSLIEECPHDIRFFIRARGYSELGLMFLIFAATILYSLPLGIALGMGLSILRVIRHATQPRIQILGRVPGTSDQFENAEEASTMGFSTASALATATATAQAIGSGAQAALQRNVDSHQQQQRSLHSRMGSNVEFVPHALIVKIPEPLTFANTGDLSARLRRLELYGTQAAHPALPRVRSEEHLKNILFDVHGVTSIDASGAQVLAEIVEGYVRRGSRVFFCRVVGGMEGKVGGMFERSGIVECVERGGGGFAKGVEEGLRMAGTERRGSVDGGGEGIEA